MAARLELIALERFPLVEPGNDLAGLLMAALQDNQLTLQDGDVLVIAQKIVSKAEGRYIRLAEVQPSARQLRRELARRSGTAPQIIINDSAGRAWRNGTVGMAIGTAGLLPVRSQVGERDLCDNVLEVTEPAEADELAAAASLLMGQAAQARPVVLARGACLQGAECGSGALLRERSRDLFR